MRLHVRRGTLAKSSKRRHVVNVGVCNVHFYHLLPYATLLWVGKSAFIAFIIVCVQAPADGKGGAPVVRAVQCCEARVNIKDTLESGSGSGSGSVSGSGSGSGSVGFSGI